MNFLIDCKIEDNSQPERQRNTKQKNPIKFIESYHMHGQIDLIGQSMQCKDFKTDIDIIRERERDK